MKNIIMYTGPMSNFLDASKKGCFLEIILNIKNRYFNKDGLMDEMIKKANGKRTIPQIFFDNLHIGGYQELRNLEKTGKLNNLLK